MNFIGAAVSDKGIIKTTNQDSVCLKVAETTDFGKVVLVMVCDGMGGLEKGEVASATAVKTFSEWFAKEFPNMLMDFSWEAVKNRWNIIIQNLNTKLIAFGKQSGVNLGTTLTAMLVVKNQYLIAHVGDSRVYVLDHQITQITKDQTFVAREIQAGHMTPEEAKKDPRRNMLLQCVGASKKVIPDFIRGTIEPDTVYLFCSDGFRHVVTEQEIFDRLNPASVTNPKDTEQICRDLVEIIKSRNERDNISVALIKSE